MKYKLDMSRKKTRAFFLLLTALFIIMSFGVPHFMEASKSPYYCSSCHIMESRFESWFTSGAHKEIKCVDCHLPNDNFFNHTFTKSLNGLKEFFLYYTGLASEDMRATQKSKKIIRANCVRCHGDMVSIIEDDKRNCWQCHRTLYHNRIP